MYDYVTEYNGTPENNSGKTVYQYDIDKSKKTGPRFSDAQLNRHLDWRYGQMLSKQVYKRTGNTYTMVEKTKMTMRKNWKTMAQSGVAKYGNATSLMVQKKVIAT